MKKLLWYILIPIFYVVLEAGRVMADIICWLEEKLDPLPKELGGRG